jgi:CRISPR/Cas system CSM-associated protein Csm2 small subunit
MGEPTSAIVAETFIQYLEHTIFVGNLEKLRIIDYYRCVDDIIIIYNTRTTNINDTLEEFNKIHHRIKFTVEEEINNKINFLDISIAKTHNTLQLGIYRKSTTRDVIVHNY